MNFVAVKMLIGDRGKYLGSRPRFLLAIVAVALAGCGSDRSARALPGSAAAPRQVRVATAAEAEIARTVSAAGTLAAEDQVVLGAKVIGRLSEIKVDLGSRVQKSQAIARIDPNDYRLRVDQAEAALQQARVRLGLSPEGKSERSRSSSWRIP
jgi:multidrug efflux pump subunit AcrA (membrane-fusion protein)